MMVIDCHAHFVPPSLLEAVRRDACKYPSLRLVEDAYAAAARTGRSDD